MNRASIAVAAGALTLAGISTASAQTIIVEGGAYAPPVYGIAPAAPVYSAPVAIESAPRVFVEPAPRVYAAPAPRVYVAPAPRVYTAPTPRVYAAPAPRVYAAPAPRVYAAPAPVYAAPVISAQTATREVVVTETEPAWSASPRLVYREW
jgi:hypothetical protein